MFQIEYYKTSSYNKVLEWIFQNTNDLQNKKTEEQDKKSLSSVSAPLTELFSEPFLRDLDLIWRLDSNINFMGDRNRRNFKIVAYIT